MRVSTLKNSKVTGETGNNGSPKLFKIQVLPSMQKVAVRSKMNNLWVSQLKRGKSFCPSLYIHTIVALKLRLCQFLKIQAPDPLFILLAGFCCQCHRGWGLLASKYFRYQKPWVWNRGSFDLLGQPGLSFNLTAWGLALASGFVMTDLINEYYGPKAIRFYPG